MSIKAKIVSQEEILKILKERENGKFVSFEEMYKKGKEYIPNLGNNV